MQDLENEIYTSTTYTWKSDDKKVEYVSLEDFDRTVKELTRRINILESKVCTLNGWDTK